MTTASLPESLIATLPGHYYTDAEVFALEQEKVFEAMWFCIVRAADLEKPGAFKTVQVGRESVLVARSRSGRCVRSSTSVATAVRACVPRRAGRSSARSSAPITPGPTTWMASWWPRPT